MSVLPKTIRGEFALFAVSIALPLVALIGYGLYDRTRDDIAASESVTRRVADANADRVSEYIAGLRATLEAVAARPLVRAMDASRCDPRLADLVDLYPRAGSLIMVDREGVILCGSMPLPPGRVVRVADEELLSAMLAEPRFRVSKPIMSRISAGGHWIVSAVQPVFGDSGALVGTVAMATDLVRWQSISRPESLPAGANVTVVTPDGTIIARSTGAEKWIGRKLWNEHLMKRVLERQEGIVRGTGTDGLDRVYGIKAITGLPWFVLAGLPEENVFAPARERLVQTGALLLLILVVVTLLAWGFVARLSKPIMAIAEAVGAGAGGVTEAKIPVVGPIEVAHVARELNRMIAFRLSQADEERRTKAELEAANRQLRESERRFNDLLGNVQLISVMLDRGARITYCNEYLLRLTGWRYEEVIGRSWLELFIPPETAGIKDRLATLLTDQPEGRHGENQILTRSGERRLIRWNNSVLRSGAGEVIGTASIGEDITERETANRQLRESEERLSFALQKSRIGGWDLNLVDHSAHRTLEHDRIFGYGSLQPQWTYEMFLEHVLPGDRAEVDRRFREATAAQAEWNFECRIRRVDGQVRWIWATGEHQCGETGQAKRLAGIVQDITERKRAEDEIRDLNASLERRIAERTHQLEASNKELEAFSYSVSHDLRGPLRSMDGFALVLLEDYGDKLDAEGKDALQRVRAASQRMGWLIDDLLRLSQVTRAELKLTRVDLSGMAKAIAGALQGGHSGRTMHWTIEEGMTISADANLIRILMQNLLDNAWKFTGKTQKPAIRVGTLDRDGRSVCFVADNGAGFDMRYADRLFGAFQRLHHVDDFPGTGIGLAIAQRIIHRHDGKIWVEATEGAGATFFFTVGDLANASDRQ